MKRTLIVAMLLASLITTSMAVDMGIKYIPWSVDVLTLYYVAGGTETAATYQISLDSITIKVTGGLHPGTTQYLLDDPAVDTLDDFIAHLEAYDNLASTIAHTQVCFEGNWVATLKEHAYGVQVTTDLAVVANDTTCLGVANTATLNIDAAYMKYVSYDIPARVGRKTNIQYILSNYTFASGATAMTVYSGTTALLPNIALTTAVEKPYPTVGYRMPIAIGGGNVSLEVRITNNTTMTAGYLVIGYTYEQ